MKNEKNKSRTKSIKLKWKIYIYLLFFSALLLLIMWLFQIAFLDQFYRYVKVREIKRSAVTIERNLDNNEIIKVIDGIAKNNDICIELILENGNILYSSDAQQDCAIHTMFPNEKLRILSSAVENNGELMFYYNREDFRNQRFSRMGPHGRNFNRVNRLQTSLVYARIIEGHEKGVMAVLINSVIVPVDATVKTLRIQLYYITGFMILFSIILAFFISKKVSKPIEHINNGAKVLAQGKYNTLFQGSDYLEINELADTLNNTALELAKVDHLRKEIIANISHDLRTPLTLISGYAEAMCDLPGEMNAENVNIILKETKRLTTLVNDVLDLSKIEAGMNQLQISEYCLTQSIKTTVEHMSSLLNKEGYKISFLWDHEIMVTADERKIAQAFYNLLVNGINYTGKDNVVTIRQVVENEWVRIEVMDTGDGIEEKYIPYIWDRYYKLDKNHKRPVMGSGIGLSIVKSIIEQHQGNYGVSSTPGVGSIFWFELKIK